MASSDVAVNHYVLKGNRIQPPFPKGIQTCVFGTGCFWGSVRAALTLTRCKVLNLASNLNLFFHIFKRLIY